jgi:hypothetical protein
MVQTDSLFRHGRACPGHPRLSIRCCNKTWMPGTSPGMTSFATSPRSIGCISIQAPTSGRLARLEGRSRLPHQRLAGTNADALRHVFAELEMVRRQQDDGRSVLEPSQLLALAHPGVAGKDRRPRQARVQNPVQDMEPDARHQDGGDRHQGDGFAALEPGPDHRALVLAEQPFNSFQRDRIHVPGVAADEVDLLDPAIVRRVKAVIHAGRQPQGGKAAIAMRRHQFGIAKQVQQLIAGALDLKQLGVRDGAERADDGIARARHDLRIRVERAQAGPQFADKAIVQAGEIRLACFTEIELRKQPPASDREFAHQRVLDLAEPAHETRQSRPRDAVGQQEVQVFLLGQAGDQAPNCHESVSSRR